MNSIKISNLKPVGGKNSSSQQGSGYYSSKSKKPPNTKISSQFETEKKGFRADSYKTSFDSFDRQSSFDSFDDVDLDLSYTSKNSIKDEMERSYSKTDYSKIINNKESDAKTENSFNSNSIKSDYGSSLKKSDKEAFLEKFQGSSQEYSQKKFKVDSKTLSKHSFGDTDFDESKKTGFGEKESGSKEIVISPDQIKIQTLNEELENLQKNINLNNKLDNKKDKENRSKNSQDMYQNNPQTNSYKNEIDDDYKQYFEEENALARPNRHKFQFEDNDQIPQLISQSTGDDRFINSFGNSLRGGIQNNRVVSQFIDPKKMADAAYKRVFGKTIFTLVVCLSAFLIFGILALNFFGIINLFISPIIIVAFACFLAAVIQIYFIVLPENKFLWLFLAGILILYFLVSAFTGELLSILTIVSAVASILLLWLAFSDLEKSQIGSRIFLINNIAGESLRVTTTVISIMMCVLLFNSIVGAGKQNGKFVGAQSYIQKYFFSNKNFVDNVMIGKSSGRLSLNTLLFDTSKEFELSNGFLTKLVVEKDADNKATIDYFAQKDSGGFLTNEDVEEIRGMCKISKTQDCDAEITKERQKKAAEYINSKYPSLKGKSLDTQITESMYKQITLDHYNGMIQDFSKENEDIDIIPSQIKSALNSYSNSYIIPAFFAVALYIVLIVIRMPMIMLSNFFMWIIWQILKNTGFVRVDIEKVEAEIVSI